MEQATRRKRVDDGEPKENVELMLGPGSSVTVNYGEEVYQVQQYQSFRVGGLSATVTVAPGQEMPLSAMVRAVESRLEELVQVQFKRRMDAHIARLGEVRDAVRGRSGSTPDR
jgi:hypothetical protein